jgi:hypothetical protein
MSIKIFPSQSQWRKWTLPSKLTAIGTYIAIFTLLVWIVQFSCNHIFASKIKITETKTFIYESSIRLEPGNGAFLLVSIINNNSPTTINSIKIGGKLYLKNYELESIYAYHPDTLAEVKKIKEKHQPFINIDFTAYPYKNTKKYLQPNEKILLLFELIERHFDGYSPIKLNQVGFLDLKEPAYSRTKVYESLLFKYALDKNLTEYNNYPFDVKYREEFYSGVANLFLDTDEGLIEINPKLLNFFDRLNKYELENDSYEKMNNYWNK